MRRSPRTFMLGPTMNTTCPKCGWSNTRFSVPTGFDRFLRLFWLSPIRCRQCRHRFYRFSLRGFQTLAEPESPQVQHTESLWSVETGVSSRTPGVVDPGRVFATATVEPRTQLHGGFRRVNSYRTERYPHLAIPEMMLACRSARVRQTPSSRPRLAAAWGGPRSISRSTHSPRGDTSNSR